MTPFLPTDLELHLIAEHGVDTRLIGLTRETHPEKHEQVAEMSHEVMHHMEVADHTHN